MSTDPADPKPVRAPVAICALFFAVLLPVLLIRWLVPVDPETTPLLSPVATASVLLRVETPAAPASPGTEPTPATPTPSPAVPTFDDLLGEQAGLLWESAVALAGSLGESAGTRAILELLRRVPDLLRVCLGEEMPVVNPAIKRSAFVFLETYRRYTIEVDRELARKGRAPTPGHVRDYTSLRRAVSQRHAALYRRAMDAADRHLAEFKDRLGARVRGEGTYLLILKSQYLVYLIGEANSEILAVFPAGVGILPGQKRRRGDLKTPECPPARRTFTTTPFHVRPMVPDDPYPPGVITRGIGVSSEEPGFEFLRGGWLIMVHGTPDQGSLGTRSSLGCIRMLPRHIELLYDHVQNDSRVIILP